MNEPKQGICVTPSLLSVKGAILWINLLLGVGFSLSAEAQVMSSLAPPPGTYSGPSAISTSSGTYTNASAPPATAPGATEVGGSAPVWQGGKLPFLITASVSEVYDDNIFVQPHKVSDYITQFSLKGEYRFGDPTVSDGNFLDIYYAPSFDLYAKHSSLDAFNQNADLFYQHRFSRLTLSVEQSYVKQQQTAAALGNLVTSDVYLTTAKADYAYSDKLDLDATFTQDIVDYTNPGYTSSNEWVGDLYFLYHLDSKLSIGLGPEFGFLDIQEAPNQTYQELLGHLDYRYSQKLSFDVSGGVEYRQFQGGVPGDQLTPVFTLSGTYTPFTSTTITALGSRGYNPSYNLIGQDYIATRISLTGRQRFLQKFYFNLGFGYENDDYEFASAGLTGPTREDNYFYANTGVDWTPNNWLTASVYYKYQNDQSSFGGFAFNDNQVGISATVSY